MEKLLTTPGTSPARKSNGNQTGAANVALDLAVIRTNSVTKHRGEDESTELSTLPRVEDFQFEKNNDFTGPSLPAHTKSHEVHKYCQCAARKQFAMVSEAIVFNCNKDGR